MSDRFERARQTGKAAIITHRIRLVFSAQGQSERQVRAYPPLVLRIEAKIIESDTLRARCRERLIQYREIGLRGVCVEPTLIKGIQGQRDQISSRVPAVSINGAIRTQKIEACSEFVIASNPDQVIRNLPLGSVRSYR